MSLLHRIETVAARSFLVLFRALGPVAASNLAGALGRTVGPLIPTSRVADANLRRAMPELDSLARKRIIRETWETLARTAGEFPHLHTLRETASGPGYEIVGAEHCQALARRGGPALSFTAHFGNWEMIPPLQRTFGVRLAFVYRAAANATVDRMILDLRERAAGGPVTMFAKGAAGARGAYAHLLHGGVLGMLADQKLNDGIAAPFFGIEAMTAPTLAVFARKFRCPILPVRAERIGPARIRVIFEPLHEIAVTDDRTADIATATAWMNTTIERWVRDQPGQWLWLHRRWPKPVAQSPPLR